MNEIRSFEQIQFATIPLNSDYFNINPVAAADTFDILLLDNTVNTLNVDSYLVNANSESQFSKYLQSYNFPLIETKNITPDCCTTHKLSIVLSTQESKESTEQKRAKSTYGFITRGRFKGRRVIVSPRNHLKANEWVVEAFEPNKRAKVPVYAKACLIHEELIPDNGCVECSKTTSNKSRPWRSAKDF